MEDTKKLSNEEIVDIVDCEGLGYSITTYLSPGRISDPALLKLWNEAYEAIERVRKYLEPFDIPCFDDSLD